MINRINIIIDCILCSVKKIIKANELNLNSNFNSKKLIFFFKSRKNKIYEELNIYLFNKTLYNFDILTIVS